MGVLVVVVLVLVGMLEKLLVEKIVVLNMSVDQ